MQINNSPPLTKFLCTKNCCFSFCCLIFACFYFINQFLFVLCFLCCKNVSRKNLNLSWLLQLLYYWHVPPSTPLWRIYFSPIFLFACFYFYLWESPFIIICENLFFSTRIFSYLWSYVRISSFLWEFFEPFPSVRISRYLWLSICEDLLEHLFVSLNLCENKQAYE